MLASSADIVTSQHNVTNVTVYLAQPPPLLHSLTDFTLFKWHRLTSVFVLVITTVVTCRHILTIDINMGHFELLADSSYLHFCVRTGWNMKCYVIVLMGYYSETPSVWKMSKKQKNVANCNADTPTDLPGMTHPALPLIGLPWYSYLNRNRNFKSFSAGK